MAHKYPDFVKATKYGSGEGLCGWNCYHSFSPFLPGFSTPVYTEEELKKLNELENTPIKYNGKEYTRYEATQRQRSLERTLHAKNQAVRLLSEGGADESDIQIAEALYHKTSHEYVQFSKAMGLPQQRQRVQLKNLADNNVKSLTSVGKSGIIKSLDIDDFELMSGGRNIDPEAIQIISSVISRYEKNGDIHISDFYFGSLVADGNGTPLLQIEPTADKTLRLNINTDIFSGKTVAEIDEMLKSTEINLANNLEEAVIHECGHAKSLKGLKIKEIEELYQEIADAKINGISKIAYNDGAEALAEIEILISRGSDIPEDAMNFYNKYMRRK